MDSTNHIEVGTERDTPRGWSYDLRIERPDGSSHAATVTLGWSDHDHFSGGAWPPSVVVHRLVALLIEQRPDLDLPEHFDAATIRRWVPDIDARLRASLGSPPTH